MWLNPHASHVNHWVQDTTGRPNGPANLLKFTQPHNRWSWTKECDFEIAFCAQQSLHIRHTKGLPGCSSCLIHQLTRHCPLVRRPPCQHHMSLSSLVLKGRRPHVMSGPPCLQNEPRRIQGQRHHSIYREVLIRKIARHVGLAHDAKTPFSYFNACEGAPVGTRDS
jgi:hypothetical protein